MIERSLQKIIRRKLDSSKAIIIMGVRQVGKTTVLNQLFGNIPGTLCLNGDEPDVQVLFQNISSGRLKL